MQHNRKFRILVVADLNFAEKGPMRLRAMEKIGLDVMAASHTRLYEAGQGNRKFSLSYRIANRMGFCPDSENINRRIRHLIDRNDFDAVWVEKGNMIIPPTLRYAKSRPRPPRIVWYSEDDMFMRHNRSRAFERALPHYDLVFTTKNRNSQPEELPAMGARRVVFVDKAFDPEQHFPIDISEDERSSLGGDIGFVGTYERERGEAMLFLAEHGLKVRIWGNGWEAFPNKHENLFVEGRAVINSVDDLSYTKAIRATKINLGFLRKLNRDEQTDRSVEIPACGGFMLAERSADHLRLFDEGKEAEFFESRDELLNKARHYLEDDDKREKIATAGRNRCVEGDYTHLNRVRFMMSQVFNEPL
jgi:spore maturation protein CgeB